MTTSSRLDLVMLFLIMLAFLAVIVFGCTHTPAMTQALADHETAARVAWERCRLSDGCDAVAEDDWRAFVEQAVYLRVAASPGMCQRLTPEVQTIDPILWDACRKAATP